EGESVLAWDAETGEPLSPIVVWSDKRSEEVLARLGADEDEIRRRSGLPLDPYFSAGKLAWLLEHGIEDRPGLRLGNVDAFLTERLGAGFATDPSTVSRTMLGVARWDPWLCERFGVPVERLPAVGDSVGELGALRHPAWPAEVPLRATVPDSGGVGVLPALSGLGAPWWRPGARAVVAGMTAGTRPAHVARAALEAIAWRVADIAAVVDGEVGLDVLRVDGGLTRDALLLELQADAAGVPVERGLVDATVAGVAALAAVGAGLWSPTRQIAERLPRGERVEPRRDDAWRAAEHAAWRAFVERAAEL